MISLMSHLVLKIAREAKADEEGNPEKVNLVRCKLKLFYLLFYRKKKMLQIVVLHKVTNTKTLEPEKDPRETF